MGVILTTVILDSHVVHWWTAEELSRLSRRALRTIEHADSLLVASITWWELAWLVRSGRIRIERPLRSWLDGLAQTFGTLELTPAIAETAASLGRTFPNDPADRVILATAMETGYRLITKDERMRAHPHTPKLTIW